MVFLHEILNSVIVCPEFVYRLKYKIKFFFTPHIQTLIFKAFNQFVFSDLIFNFVKFILI